MIIGTRWVDLSYMNEPDTDKWTKRWMEWLQSKEATIKTEAQIIITSERRTQK